MVADSNLIDLRDFPENPIAVSQVIKEEESRAPEQLPYRDCLIEVANTCMAAKPGKKSSQEKAKLTPAEPLVPGLRLQEFHAIFAEFEALNANPPKEVKIQDRHKFINNIIKKGFYDGCIKGKKKRYAILISSRMRRVLYSLCMLAFNGKLDDNARQVIGRIYFQDNYNEDGIEIINYKNKRCPNRVADRQLGTRHTKEFMEMLEAALNKTGKKKAQFIEDAVLKEIRNLRINSGPS